jgi:hypothetical protein
MRWRGCLGLGMAAVLAVSKVCIAQTESTAAHVQLGELISRVCPDGWDEDWRADGPVIVLTGERRGGGFDDYAPAFRTPFVLYGDGTVIAGAILNRKGRFEGWRHRKYYLDPKAVIEIRRSLGWDALLKLENNYWPIHKEEHRWAEEHQCFDACWPILELHLWSEGCRKTISIAGIDNIFMQYLAHGIRPDLNSNEADRFVLAQLAFKRLPQELKAALRRLAAFRLSGGTSWCQGDDCYTKALPWHESWGFRGKFLVISPPTSENKADVNKKKDVGAAAGRDAVERGVAPDGRSPSAPARR